MDRLRALQYFVASAEEGSFAGAARRLDVSVPSVHRMVTALERTLGIALFDRSAQGLAPTASGARYLDACRPLLDELAAIDDAVALSAQRPAGTLSIGAHPQIAHPFLMPALPRFRVRYPEIRIDLRVIHRLDDRDAAMLDVFLLHGWPQADDLVHRRLERADSLVVAAPSYWAAHGIPRRPEDLARHACLVLRNPAGILLDLWEFEREGARVQVAVDGWLESNDREIVLDGVLAGEGVARVTRLTSRAHVQTGRLVPVLTDWVVQGGPPLNLLYRPALRRAPRVRAFIDFVDTLLREADADDAAPARRPTVALPDWHRRGAARASSAIRLRR